MMPDYILLIIGCAVIKDVLTHTGANFKSVAEHCCTRLYIGELHTTTLKSIPVQLYHAGIIYS